MAKSLLMAADLHTTTQNTTQYTFITGRNVLYSTEAPTQIPFRDAGTISKFGVKINANTTSTDTVIRLRKNGSIGNQLLTIPGGQTGEFIDTSNTDSISAGDKISVQIVTPNTGTVDIENIAALYEPTDTEITTTRMAIGGPVNYNASTVFYNLLNGDLDLDDTTTTDHRIVPRVAGSFKHWAMYSSAGGRAVACRLLKNNVDDVINRVLINTNVTGLGENTADSIAVDDDDDVTTLHVYGGSGTTRTLDFIALSFVNTGPYSLLVAGQSDSFNRAAGNTDYHRIAGYMVGHDGEDGSWVTMRGNFRLSKLAVRIEGNSLNTGTSTFTLRKNGVDTLLSVSISAGSSNTTFVDNTNSVDVEPGDELNYEFAMSGSSGTIGLTWASMLVEDLGEVGGGEPINMDVSDTIVLTNKFITKV